MVHRQCETGGKAARNGHAVGRSLRRLALQALQGDGHLQGFRPLLAFGDRHGHGGAPAALPLLKGVHPLDGGRLPIDRSQGALPVTVQGDKGILLQLFLGTGEAQGEQHHVAVGVALVKGDAPFLALCSGSYPHILQSAAVGLQKRARRTGFAFVVGLVEQPAQPFPHQGNLRGHGGVHHSQAQQGAHYGHKAAQDSARPAQHPVPVQAAHLSQCSLDPASQLRGNGNVDVVAVFSHRDSSFSKTRSWPTALRK